MILKEFDLSALPSKKEFKEFDLMSLAPELFNKAPFSKS
jgi:hypothetical protein